jgi:DNA-binding XRE family transcriptional regulator
MTPTEFKQSRQTLGLSVPEAAFILGTSERTVRKWELESDPRPVNPIASRVMAWLLDGYEPPQMRWLLDGRKPSEWEGE